MAETISNSELLARNILDGGPRRSIWRGADRLRPAARIGIGWRRNRRRLHVPQGQDRAGHRLHLGIGLACAKALAAEGAAVMINGFGNPAAIEAERAALAAASGAGAAYSPADMTRPDEIAAMVRACADQLGGPDILMSNAGVQHVSPIEDFPIDKWTRSSRSTSPPPSTRSAPRCRHEGEGLGPDHQHRLGAFQGRLAFKSAYVAAKHGIDGLTKTVALELATAGITANSISPGYVWTPLVEKQIPDTMAARGMTREQVINDVLLAGQPTRRFVTVDQVAALALFLCRDEAAQITGTNLSVDGGWTAG